MIVAARTRRSFGRAILALFAALVPVEQSQGQPAGRLQRVGALSCVATAGERPEATRLVCELRLQNGPWGQMYEGRLVNSGLHLVEPGTVNAVWSVLSPTRELDPAGLVGGYATASIHDFAYEQKSDQLLVGGVHDSVGLELMAPAINAVRPGTTLSLAVLTAGR